MSNWQKPKRLIIFALLTLAGWNVAPSFADTKSGDASEQNIAAMDFDARLHKVFADALALIQESKESEARPLLEEALALKPDSAAIHCNLGLVYENTGSIETALAQFRQALALQLRMPEATLNIGSCYQCLGDTGQAIIWYRQYLKENPKAKDAGTVSDLIEALEATATNRSCDPRLPDYFDNIIRHGTFTWSASALPIKLFIEHPANAPGYSPSFPTIVTDAFQEWIEASDNKLSYKLVNDPLLASVIVQWTNDPSMVSGGGSKSERGSAHFDQMAGQIYKANIRILTVPILEGAVLSDLAVKKTCLHEIGHILGLNGHSTNPHDVMFFTVDSATVRATLTNRDRATIMRLYQLHEKL